MIKQSIKLISLLFLVINAQAETVYVTLEKDNAVALVDPVAGKLLKTVEVGRRPRGLAFSPDYKILYIAVSDDNAIKLFDSETLKKPALCRPAMILKPLRSIPRATVCMSPMRTTAWLLLSILPRKRR